MSPGYLLYALFDKRKFSYVTFIMTTTFLQKHVPLHTVNRNKLVRSIVEQLGKSMKLCCIQPTWRYIHPYILCSCRTDHLCMVQRDCSFGVFRLPKIILSVLFLFLRILVWVGQFFPSLIMSRIGPFHECMLCILGCSHPDSLHLHVRGKHTFLL